MDIEKNFIRLIKYNNYPNTLFYNNYNNIIQNTYHKIYNIVNKTIIFNNIKYIKNNIYYEFNLYHIKYKDRNDLVLILQNIIESDNYFKKNKKIIILKNVSYNLQLQNIFKKLIENNNHVIFIILTKKHNNIIEAIRSRFLCIRIPNISYYDKYKLLNKLSVKNISVQDYIKNKHNSIEYIYYLNNIDTLKDRNIFTNISNFIFKKIYEEKNLKNIIQDIKKLSYILVSINIQNNIFFKYLIYYIINDITIVYKNKIKSIKLITDIEYNLLTSYYKMIQYEYMFLNLYNIIKT